MHPTIYLDANATTPVLPAAIAAATRAMMEQFGNPSSSHSSGIVAKAFLDQTRAMAAQVIGAGDGHVVFTSGATEGIQTAVLSALRSIAQRRETGQKEGERAGHLLVYGATEHKAVPQALAHWNAVLGLGLELRALPVNAQGQHDLYTLAAWLPDTALLCTMAANNETGVITDLTAIEQLLGGINRNTLWLVDCVQALGKLPLDLQTTRIDYAAFSGHKLYAPKGIGMLYVRRGAPFTPLMAGGGQEGGLRAGTENMPGIAALGAVLNALQSGDTFASVETLRSYRDQLERSLRCAFPNIEFNAPLAHSLPTTLNFSVTGLTSKNLLDVFDAAGLRVSAGSACSAAQAAPSDVLAAMGLPECRASSAVRLSIGPLASPALIAAACEAIAQCGRALQGLQADETRTPDIADCSAQEAAALTLHWSELDAFLCAHPNARLVDVREAAEYQVGPLVRHGAWAAVNAPLSALDAFAQQWAEYKAAPVVLVCRSGNRSLKAAQWLRSQGLTHVRHLHGGLALRPKETTQANDCSSSSISRPT
ncbi:MAG: aminotransferase class V-fold PLP-dependent enzyme [Rhodoferax sp.]|nr:aminotransferase class V-fold PLP-dependent enzyme [Rhodoferax sp.]